MTILIKIGDFRREKFQRNLCLFRRQQRNDFFFLKKFPLHREEFRKQHFSNRHSVLLISKRTLRVFSYFPLFPFAFHSTSCSMHVTSFFLPFRRVSLPSDVLNYHPSTNFLLLFFSHSAPCSHDKTGNKQAVKLFNSDSNARVRIEREIFMFSRVR